RDGAFVRPLENDLDGRVLDSRLFEHRGQWHAAPLGVADGALPPLNPECGRDQMDATVAGAFQRRGEGLGAELLQVVESEFQWGADRAFDLEPPGLHVHGRDREVIADEEVFIGDNRITKLGKRELQVPRLIASDDEPGKGRLDLLSASPGGQKGGGDGCLEEGAASGRHRYSGGQREPASGTSLSGQCSDRLELKSGEYSSLARSSAEFSRLQPQPIRAR